MDKRYIRGICLEKIASSSFSSDFIPSGNHLFRKLQNYLDGLKLTSREILNMDWSHILHQNVMNFTCVESISIVDRWNDDVNIKYIQ